MEQINKELRIVRANITKGINKEFNIEDAKEIQRKLIDLNDKLITCYINEDMDVPKEVEDRIDDYNQKINSYIEKKSNSTDNTLMTSVILNRQMNNDQNQHYGVNYHISDIPKFSGKYIDWYTYKCIAKPIILTNNIDDLKAKSYLIQTLSECAKRRIMRLLNSNATVQNLWTKLEEIYEDEEKFLNECRAELDQCPNVKNENDIESLRKIKNAADAVMGALESLEHTNYLLDSVMINVLSSKFYYRANREISAKCKTFKDAVERITMMYEECERYLRSQAATTSTSNKSATKTIASNRFSTTNKTSNFSMINRIKCSLCHQGHTTEKCPNLNNIEWTVGKLRENNVCTRCGKSGHKFRECRTRNYCTTCNYGHATWLHDAVLRMIRPNNNQSTTNASNTSNQASSNNQSATNNSNNSAIVINNESTTNNTTSVAAIDVRPTLVNEVAMIMNNTDDCQIEIFIKNNRQIPSRPILSGDYKNKEVDILLDPGSTVSLISASLITNESTFVTSSLEIISPVNQSAKQILDRSIKIKFTNNIASCVLTARIFESNENLIIIGTDQLYKFFNIQATTLSFDTIFGQAKFMGPSASDSGTACIDDDFVDLTAEENIMKQMNGVMKLPNGRYQIKLPFLSDNKPPDNFGAAFNSLVRLQKRLKNNGFFDIYQNQLLEYVTNDHAEITRSKNGYFMTHLEVIRQDSASTPIRIVFNGSYGHPSLNDYLWKGNAKGLNVWPHLLKFRFGKYAVVADLSKAFLQILVHPDHRQFLKFMWLDSNNELKLYQMKVLPFGLISSPAILTSIIQDIMTSNDLNSLVDAVYMDDFLLSSDSKQMIMNTLKKAQDILKQAGFILHKVKTNVPEHVNDPDEMIKVLGINWHIKKDELSLKIPDQPDVPITKRELLAFLNKIYDPIGLVEPWKLKLKLILREIRNNDWDDILNDDVKENLRIIIHEYPLLKTLSIPRNMNVQNISLAGFSDASIKAIGFVIFARQDDDLEYMISKTKLVPMRNFSIVELELIALFELVKFMMEIKSTFNTQHVYLYCDSKINLNRLKMTPNKYGRRIATTLMKTTKMINQLNAKIFHISGDTNPADIYTKPVNINELKNYYNHSFKLSTLRIDPNPVPVFETCIVNIKSNLIDNEEFKQLKDLPSMLQFIKKRYPGLDSSQTMNKIYQYAQINLKVDDLKVPIIHEDHLYKVNFRRNEFTPIIIPKKSNLTEILINDLHVNRGHTGIRDTEANLSLKYYIPGVRKLIKSRIKYCIECQKLRKKPVVQPLGILPNFRKDKLLPFRAISTDIFGPMKYHNGKKFYGLIVTCLSTRFIRLEVITSLSADESYRALLNIMYQNGIPNIIYSDNGTNFVSLKSKFDKQQEKQEVKDIQWLLTPPLAPWFNGVTERLIKSVKQVMYGLNIDVKSTKEVASLFAQIESVINSRPMLQIDERFVSPYELIYGRPYYPSSLSNDTITNIGFDINTGRIYKYLCNLKERFQRLWKNQYLLSLEDESKNKPVEIKNGCWVMIPEEFKKRPEWPLAKVIEIFKDTENIVRRVRIDFNGKTFIRAINGLVVLEQPPAEDVVNHEN